MTDEEAETRQMYKDLVMENKGKSDDDKLQIRMHKGRIMVNNSMLRQKVTPPTNSDTLRLTELELESIQVVKLIKGGEHVEKGSDFYVYITKVASTCDVDKAYLKMRIKYGDSMHISCAYRLAHLNGPYQQHAVDDTDYGCARTMLKVLKEKELTEVAVFLAHNYGGLHLRARRFEVFEQMAQKAARAWYKHITKCKDRQSRYNSQSSLASFTSQVSEAENETNDDGQEDPQNMVG